MRVTGRGGRRSARAERIVDHAHAPGLDEPLTTIAGQTDVTANFARDTGVTLDAASGEVVPWTISSIGVPLESGEDKPTHAMDRVDAAAEQPVPNHHQRVFIGRSSADTAEGRITIQVSVTTPNPTP
jgi:phosphoenolpyruvate carboxylase